MNIAEILKNAPEEAELYSPTFGNVTLREVLKNGCTAEIHNKFFVTFRNLIEQCKNLI